MDKHKLIVFSYQIATLTYPSDEVVELLHPLSHERIMELMLVIRQSARPIKSPVNFLRRAIASGWNPETMALPIRRSRFEIEVKFYQQQGYSLDDAKRLALVSQLDYV